MNAQDTNAQEPTQGDAVTLTGSQVHVASYLALAHRLALEVTTGLPFSNRGPSTMSIAKRVCGSPRQTKRGVLADLVAFIKRPDVHPTWEPGASITRALAKPSTR